jgi:hypothetical protein
VARGNQRRGSRDGEGERRDGWEGERRDGWEGGWKGRELEGEPGGLYHSLLEYADSTT